MKSVPLEIHTHARMHARTCTHTCAHTHAHIPTNTNTKPKVKKTEADTTTTVIAAAYAPLADAYGQIIKILTPLLLLLLLLLLQQQQQLLLLLLLLLLLQSSISFVIQVCYHLMIPQCLSPIPPVKQPPSSRHKLCDSGEVIGWWGSTSPSSASSTAIGRNVRCNCITGLSCPTLSLSLSLRLFLSLNLKPQPRPEPKPKPYPIAHPHPTTRPMPLPLLLSLPSGAERFPLRLISTNPRGGGRQRLDVHLKWVLVGPGANTDPSVCCLH